MEDKLAYILKEQRQEEGKTLSQIIVPLSSSSEAVSSTAKTAGAASLQQAAPSSSKPSTSLGLKNSSLVSARKSSASSITGSPNSFEKISKILSNLTTVTKASPNNNSTKIVQPPVRPFVLPVKVKSQLPNEHSVKTPGLFRMKGLNSSSSIENSAKNLVPVPIPSLSIQVQNNSDDSNQADDTKLLTPSSNAPSD